MAARYMAYWNKLKPTRWRMRSGQAFPGRAAADLQRHRKELDPRKRAERRQHVDQLLLAQHAETAEQGKGKAEAFAQWI